MHPNDQISDFSLYGSLFQISGLLKIKINNFTNQQYSGVPFYEYNKFDFLILDILKSPILHFPFEKRKIFEGLISLWQMNYECNSHSPDSI